jgi:hypothetical protein
MYLVRHIGFDCAIGQHPSRSVFFGRQRDGVSQRKAVCVCRELDRSGFLPTPIPFGLLRVMGSLGTLNVQYLMVEIFAWNGAASSLMPTQIPLHINCGVSFLANSTRFLLHRRDCLHVHISGRYATISAMLYRDYC